MCKLIICTDSFNDTTTTTTTNNNNNNTTNNNNILEYGNSTILLLCYNSVINMINDSNNDKPEEGNPIIKHVIHIN